jgi:hypothetical protein
MENKNKCASVGLSAIVCSFLAILVCAVPCVARVVNSGDTLNLGTGYPDEQILNDWLDVCGTLNMYSGAYVDWGINAWAGSTVNIYAGEIGADYPVWVFAANAPDETDAVVTVYGTAFALDDTPLDPIPDQVTFTQGIGTLTVTYGDSTIADLLFYSDIPVNLVDIGGGAEPTPIDIDIKPGSYPNTINLGSNGVVPVAILSSASFDATQVDADTVDLAGAGVAVRGKGNNTLAHEEDVNGDGLMDLVVQVETENLDPGTFQDGGAVLQVKDGETVLYEGSDEITIVPPE